MDVQQLVALEEQAYRDRDWDRLAELYDEQVQLVGADGSAVKGREQVLAYFRQEEEAFDDVVFSQQLVAGSDDVAVLEWSWSGTHARDLVAPSGQRLAATGNRVALEAVSIVRCKDGRVVSVRRYHDRLAVLVQLGVLPAPPGGQ